MRVLITGGAGFVGRHLAAHFADKAEVRVLDSLRSGCARNLEGVRCELIEGSILDRDLLRTTMRGADYVFHFAALVSVPESMANPAECARLNVEGTRAVLEEAARAGVKKLVFSSSSAIYGDGPENPKREEMPPEPRSPYAISKLEGEHLCQAFNQQGLTTVALRYFNVFGAFQNPRSQYAAAIPLFIERALADQPIVIFGDGTQTRDFVHVSDVVAANVFFAMESPASGVFNIASGEARTINRLAEIIRSLVNSKSGIEHASERSGDVKHSTADLSKAKSAGFTPICDFNQGLRETVDFFRAKPR